MKVICEFSNGQNLSEEYWEIGFSKKTIFDVNIGSEYLVYGISLWRKQFFYLICDEYNLPNWYPAEIFKVVDNRISKNWKFKLSEFYDEYSVEALIGYPELIDIENHYAELIERDSEALKIFANLMVEN